MLFLRRFNFIVAHFCLYFDVIFFLKQTAAYKVQFFILTHYKNSTLSSSLERILNTQSVWKCCNIKQLDNILFIYIMSSKSSSIVHQLLCSLHAKLCTILSSVFHFVRDLSIISYLLTFLKLFPSYDFYSTFLTELGNLKLCCHL